MTQFSYSLFLFVSGTLSLNAFNRSHPIRTKSITHWVECLKSGRITHLSREKINPVFIVFAPFKMWFIFFELNQMLESPRAKQEQIKNSG